MSVIIKNDSGVTKVYGGVQIADQGQYTIQELERYLFSGDETLISDIATADAIVNDGTVDLGVSDGLDHLKGYSQKSPVDVDGHPIYKGSAFSDANGFRARFKGITGTATKTTTTNIDYKMPEDRYINGVRLIMKNHEDGDYVKFQVVDVDNILGYGAGTVLDEFGDTWYVDSASDTQPDVIVPYPAKILKDLYIRIIYNSTGTTNDVTVRANLYLHKKTV